MRPSSFAPSPPTIATTRGRSWSCSTTSSGEFGYVDRSWVAVIADELNLSRAEVHGVVSFYHDFRDQAGRL